MSGLRYRDRVVTNKMIVFIAVRWDFDKVIGWLEVVWQSPDLAVYLNNEFSPTNIFHKCYRKSESTGATGHLRSKEFFLLQFLVETAATRSLETTQSPVTATNGNRARTDNRERASWSRTAPWRASMDKDRQQKANVFETRQRGRPIESGRLKPDNAVTEKHGRRKPTERGHETRQHPVDKTEQVTAPLFRLRPWFRHPPASGCRWLQL